MSWATTLGVVASVGIAVGVTSSPASAKDPIATISDDFSSGTYSGGSAGWAGDWDETGETVDPNAGRIRIVDERLQFTDLDDRTISRPIDLSPHAAHDVVLSFDWYSENSEGEELWVELRNSSGTWVRVAELDDTDSGGHSPLPVTLSVQLEPDLVSSNSGIRFRSTTADTGWGETEQFVIDNVRFDVDTILDNPDLPVSCGIDVTIVLDESGSIEDATNGIAEVENAVRALVDGLKNTGSRLKITEFSTNGRAAVVGGSTDFQLVDATFESAVETYLGNGGSAQNADNYNPGVGEEWTNWEAGLAPATSNPGELLVFITDGQPNTIGTAGTSVPGEYSGDRRVAAAAALDELDAIKAAGTHVLAIGVGAASTQENFDLLTRTVQPGTAQVWEGTGDLDLSVTDAIRVGAFDALDNALRQVVFALCAPSVSITKVNDAGTPIEGWSFSGTVDVLPQGGADQFEWVSPSAGISPDANATQSDTTDSNGVALFQWTPNTVADPEPWDSTFTFTETLPAGWTVAAQQQQCAVQRLDGNGDVQPLVADLAWTQNGPVVTFSLQEAGTDDTFLLAKSDIVTCEVRNNRPSTIVVEKVTLPASSETFDFTGSNGIGAFTVDGGSSTQLMVPAGTYTISENTPPANWHFVSADGQGCSPTQTAGAVSVTVGPNETVTCTFTNEGTANLKLEKEWVVGRDGDTADMSTNGGYGDDEIDYQSVSDGTDLQLDTGGPTIEIPIGSAVTLSEIVEPSARYTSELECRDDVDGGDVFVVNSVAQNGRSGSITAGDGAVGATIICTFSNPRREAMIVVEKNLVPSTDDGVFDLQINGVTVVDDGGDGASNAGDPVVVKVGDSATVAELAGDGSPVGANYGSAVNCVGLDELVVGTTSVTFEIPSEAADQTITCTFTNTRKSASLTVEKTWVNAAIDDAVSITTTGAANDVDFDSTANSANETDTDPNTSTVYAGETLTFSEAFTTGDAEGYATTLSCTGATDTDPTDGLTIDALDTGADITCTYTNVRNSATFTLDKAWVLANAGDGVRLQADGSDDNDQEIDTSSTAPVGAGGSMIVYSGEIVSFSESFTSGSAANYNTTIVCTDGSGTLLDDSSLSGQLTVAADPSDITCTFTNTLKTSALVLQKTWVDGNAGDTAELSAGDAPSATSTSSGAPGSETDTQNQVILAEVFVGDTIDLSELLSAPANYDTTWSCDDAAGSNGSGRSGQVTITPADENQLITCTFTNTRKRADLVVIKSWADSPVDDSAVSLAIAGGDAEPTPGSSTNDGVSNDTAATSVVFAGEQISISETFDGPDGVNYDADWACDNSALSSGTGTSGGLTVVAADTDTTITCTFTNTRKRADVTLTKVWDGAFDGDTVALSIASGGTTGDGSSVAPGAATTDATLTVYAGDSVSLSETFTIGLPTTYDTTLVCSGNGALTTDTVGSTVSASLPATSDPQATTCTFTNAGIPGVSVAKQFVSATDADGDGVYDVRYQVTVTNAGPGAETYDLSDTPSFDDDVVILSASGIATGGPADPTGQDPWVGPSWTLATDQTIAGSTDAPVVHLYTLDFVVDATDVLEDPSAYDLCDGQEPVAGEGLFNTATLTIDEQGIDAIDCGDISTITIVKTDDVDDGDSVQPGEAYRYSLVVTNNGPLTVLPGLVVDDDLPDELSLVSVTGGAGWSCNSSDPLACTFAPEIAAGASTTPITVTVRVAEDATGTEIVNVAVATGRVDRECPETTDGPVQAAEDCGEVTDDDDETTPLSTLADLAIEKSASVEDVGAGGGFEWILEIVNNGPGVARDVEIGDVVPSAVTVTGVSSSDFDCGRSGNSVTCTVASLAVGDSGTVTITVSVPATAPDGSVTNVATVESETPDPDLTNNSDDATVAIVAQAVVTTTTLPPVTLPRTGSDATSPVTQAAWILLLAGIGIVTLARRRRPVVGDDL